MRLGPGRELIELCGRHPLALAITARHASLRPLIPLAEFTAELRALGLDVLDGDDPAASLPAVLSWSLRRLTDAQRTLFGLLGIAPGPDSTLPAAASLAALTPARARTALSALEEASLVDRRPGGRYAMHDLVRAFAATHADATFPEPVRQAALDRVVDFYLHTCHTAHHLVEPNDAPSRSEPPAPGVRPLPLSDQAAALAWLDAEHPHLLAAQRIAAAHHRHHAVWELAWNLTTFHKRRGHRRDNLAVWQLALDAAAHLPDPVVRIRALRHVGTAHALLNRHRDATDHLHRALAQADHHQETLQQAGSHMDLASSWMEQGNSREALEHARSALGFLRVVGNPIWEAARSTWWAGVPPTWATTTPPATTARPLWSCTGSTTTSTARRPP